MDYKSTLNMPKSGFPMRAGLPKREPEMLKHWEEMDLYNLMLKKNEGKPRFALHDGPPFSNGGLHMGHALNKSLKDFITRSYAMRGYYTPYIPGWDNHGMPIESAIIKQNKLNHKAMPVSDAVRILDDSVRLPAELPFRCIAALLGKLMFLHEFVDADIQALQEI